MAVPVIRKPRSDEFGLVVDLLRRANEEHLLSFPAPVADGYRAELAEVADLVGTPAEVFVLAAADRLLGTVTFLPDASDDAHPWPGRGSVLRFLAVMPDARGRGVGEELVSFCIERARARGAQYLGLHTAPMMSAARRLYERMGFVRDSTLDFAPGDHYGGDASDQEARWGLAYVLHFPAVEA